MLKSRLSFLYKDTSETFKVLFQNVRSLHLHVADVASDYNVKAADINIFVETALLVMTTMNSIRFQAFNSSEMTSLQRVLEHLTELLFT